MNLISMAKQKDGFLGEQALVLPPAIVQRMKTDPATSILYISCILLSLGNIHLYAQKITKYGKVQLHTSIMQASTDVIKANLICGKDTLKEDYRNAGFIFWNKFPSASHEPSCGPTDLSRILIHYMCERDKRHEKTFI